MSDQAAAAGLIRRVLLALAAAGILAVAFELGSARHWDSTVQLVPWAALLVAAVALGLAAARPDGAA